MNKCSFTLWIEKGVLVVYHVQFRVKYMQCAYKLCHSLIKFQVNNTSRHAVCTVLIAMYQLVFSQAHTEQFYPEIRSCIWCWFINTNMEWNKFVIGHIYNITIKLNFYIHKCWMLPRSKYCTDNKRNKLSLKKLSLSDQ